ncbi:6-phosphogluconate dehydrogenase, decarboxylating 1 [Artemisia annua]|uniref:6-phosphogluconate dehydrogenase, decarboxylating 1 n=1 Tax=Artemisia annua TaxID=35608 RepID=A0A2U1LGE9_ARTAN|nr:6-phosphogluconate dehydrogenase, decarboxylating 1 [Artemisia annua]
MWTEVKEFFGKWNKGELLGHHIDIFESKADKGARLMVDEFLESTEMKEATGWTVHQLVGLSLAAPAIAAALD